MNKKTIIPFAFGGFGLIAILMMHNYHQSHKPVEDQAITQFAADKTPAEVKPGLENNPGEQGQPSNRTNREVQSSIAAPANLSVDDLLALYNEDKIEELMDELRRQKYSDPYYLEDLFQKYVSSNNPADREKITQLMKILKEQSVVDVIANKLQNTTGVQQASWLKIVADTQAFANPVIRDSIISILDGADDPSLVKEAFGALNPNLSQDVDKSKVAELINRHTRHTDPHVRIAAYQQQAKWLDSASVKEGLSQAFNDEDGKVKIAAMSIMEASNIKDESYKNTVINLFAQAQPGSDMYNYAEDTLKYYYNFNDQQLAAMR